MPIGFPEFFKQTVVDGMCFHSALFVCTPECAWSDKAWWRLLIFSCGTKRLSNGQVETIHYKLITHNWPAADPQPSKVFLLIWVKYHTVCRLTNNPPVNDIWAGPLRVVTQEKNSSAVCSLLWEEGCEDCDTELAIPMMSSLSCGGMAPVREWTHLEFWNILAKQFSSSRNIFWMSSYPIQAWVFWIIYWYTCSNPHSPPKRVKWGETGGVTPFWARLQNRHILRMW